MAKYLFGEQDGLYAFGGYGDAERKMLIFLPDYLDETSLYGEDSPCVCLRAAFFQGDSPSHRDFLGALMGAGVGRETVGDICVDKVFIGSCTNSRIEDMREAAAVVKKLGQKVAKNVKLAMVVPGSGPVKAQAEAEGLDKIFIEAGFEWRLPGCSMCLAMNNDRLNPGERCASTSNRNFEGRQGRGGRTHLVSPAMAAAAAVTGHFADIRNIK